MPLFQPALNGNDTSYPSFSEYGKNTSLSSLLRLPYGAVINPVVVSILYGMLETLELTQGGLGFLYPSTKFMRLQEVETSLKGALKGVFMLIWQTLCWGRTIIFSYKKCPLQCNITARLLESGCSLQPAASAAGLLLHESPSHSVECDCDCCFKPHKDCSKYYECEEVTESICNRSPLVLTSSFLC